MDFAFSPKQQQWHDAALQFARERLNDDILDRDERREFWREGWRRCGELGILGLPVPTSYGGLGEPPSVTIAAMEGLGYGCPDSGLLFAMNASMWTNTLPILMFGTEEQKQRYLPGLCDGSLIGANCASETEAGSDIFAMKTRAERRGDQWALNGRKTWITSGPVADMFVAFATTNPDNGPMGLSAFIVPKETPGFRVIRTINKLGMRTVPMGEAVFEDCALPLDAMLGKQGRGALVFQSSMEWERGAILASTLGTMRRQLENCIERARGRRQFGQPIGKFQAVAHRIARMKVRLETCRPLVHKIGWLKDRGEDASQDAAIAKLHVSESFVENSLDAVRIFGAAGFVAEFGVEKDLRDSVGSLIYSGTNEIQMNLIAKGLGL